MVAAHTFQGWQCTNRLNKSVDNLMRSTVPANFNTAYPKRININNYCDKHHHHHNILLNLIVLYNK